MMWRVAITILLAVVYASAVPQDDRTPNSADYLNFLVFGDWGGQESSPYTTEAEREIAVQMGKTASDINSNFTLALGDNFYDHGVHDEYDRRFKETFEDVFTAPYLKRRWYIVAGNHDHYGNASAEVAYTRHSDRWYFPSLYYTETLPIGDSGKTVQFVFIDTVLLAGLTHPTLRYLPPQPVTDKKAAEDQWTWIESTLAASKATWLYVAGHYPVWSVAEHGPTQTLVDRLKPLLEKYNVTGYLNGHDHNMQHIRPKGQSVDYFTTGAGHLTDPSMAHEHDIPEGSLLFHYGVDDPRHDHGGFTGFMLTPDAATTVFYDYEGRSLYTTKNSSPRQ